MTLTFHNKRLGLSIICVHTSNAVDVGLFKERLITEGAVQNGYLKAYENLASQDGLFFSFNSSYNLQSR